MNDYPAPEENTLGVIVGKRPSGGLPAGSTASRAMRLAGERGAGLGTGFLGVGASILAALQSIYGLVVFLSHANQYPNIAPAAAAWVVYSLALIGVTATIATRGERMPDWLFAFFLLALAAVVALDLIAIWPLHDIGRYATAAASAGFGLLAALTLRRGAELVVAASALGIVLAVAVVLSTPLTPAQLANQILLISTATMPVVVGLFTLRRFRRIVQLELDRVLVQSTVTAPRFAVGMLASEELAKLDLAAEELLESVATGRTTLPLSPQTASIAATLATELRLHLIEGRRETWLHHAITESDHLGRSVTLTDLGSLAGLLSQQQRDGLLAAIWLLVSETNKTTPTAEVDVGPVSAAGHPGTKTIHVPIVITTTAVPRNRVDPTTWDAIGKVGRYLDSTYRSSLRVEIECIVANPAGQ